jgi:esterase/lipase
MLTFDDLQNKIVAALGILLVSWGGFITAKVIESPSQDQVEKMIANAQSSSYYMQDRSAIQQSIQDLYKTVNTLRNDQERTQSQLAVMNDKISVNNEKLWTELSLLRTEIEKIKYRQDYLEDKKKRVGERPPTATDPQSVPTETDTWTTEPF